MFTKTAPEVFETRWAMSYLRGPLTRQQIKLLMDPIKAQSEAGVTRQPTLITESETPAQSVTTEAGKTAAANKNLDQNRQPILPPEIPQYFIPVRTKEPGAANSCISLQSSVPQKSDLVIRNLTAAAS